MIGRVAGTILHRGMDQVLIDVQGLGYIVHVSQRTAAALPPVGEPVALYTDLIVREDLLQLIGFPTMLEREWHRVLMSVQGVGAKVSVAILGTLGAEGLGRAIALGDWASVKAAPGVGPKLAQRIVLELKDRAPAVMALGATFSVDLAPGGAPEPAATPPRGRARPGPVAPDPRAAAAAEALSALANLGYAASEAAAAVAAAAAGEEGADTARLIRAALRRLAPKD